MSEPIELRVPDEPGRTVILFDDIPALLRDAERFRKLEAGHNDAVNPGGWAIRTDGSWEIHANWRLCPGNLADIADALTALTDSNRRNDGHS